MPVLLVLHGPAMPDKQVFLIIGLIVIADCYKCRSTS